MYGRQNQIAIRLLVLSAMIAIVTSPVTAQPSQTSPTSSLQPLEDEDQAKRSLYKQFLESLNPDPLTAYKLAQQYLQRFPEETAETRYVKKWVDYFIVKEKQARRIQVQKLINENRFNEAFVIGKAFLTSDPNDIVMLQLLIYGGISAFNNHHYANLPDARIYAKRLLHLIETGQVPDQENEKTRLNLAIGMFSLPSAPAEAATYLYKVLDFDTFKNDASTYSFLADAITGAEYLPTIKEWYARFPTAELRLSVAAAPTKRKMERAMDYIIDALARAVALAGSHPAYAEHKVQWMDTLTRFWIFRNSGYDTGLNEYIDVVLAKPLPKPLPFNFFGKGEAQ